jgi:hypothetical protein
MKGQATSPVLSTPGFSGWIEGIAARLILRAARSAPGALSERLEEEWPRHCRSSAGNGGA